MSESTFDGFYTPAPADVARDSRWPWFMVSAGLAIVIAGAVIFSGGAADHGDGSGAPRLPESSAHR